MYLVVKLVKPFKWPFVFIIVKIVGLIINSLRRATLFEEVKSQ